MSTTPTSIPSPSQWIPKLFSSISRKIGKHKLDLFSLKSVDLSTPIDALRKILKSHYVATEITANRIKELGASKTADILRDHLPISKRARSGDIGEIMATEFMEYQSRFKVPIRRLRWKDGRNMALRGDDIIGLARGKKNKKLVFRKGEAKSRAVLDANAIKKAATALEKDKGRPSRHSVLFIADRLREQGKDKVAKELEEAVLNGFSKYQVDHFLFAVTGTDPKNHLSRHLKSITGGKIKRIAIGVHINNHGKFIEELYTGI